MYGWWGKDRGLKWVTITRQRRYERACERGMVSMVGYRTVCGGDAGLPYEPSLSKLSRSAAPLLLCLAPLTCVSNLADVTATMTDRVQVTARGSSSVEVLQKRYKGTCVYRACVYRVWVWEG